MYLARRVHRGRTRYILRESVPAAEGFRHRDLCDLGPDPQRYLVYPGGNAFCFAEELLEALHDGGVEPTTEELEDLFWPFLEETVRRRLEPFRRREQRLRGDRRPRRDAPAADVHPFDRRRLFFLRTGQTDLRGIERLPASLWERFAGKSRDEIEQGFMDQEAALRPREVKAYTFAAFDLQRFFPQRYAQESPQLLDAEAMDERFLESLCGLLEDARFWGGLEPRERLRSYLSRYVVMYFDFDFGLPPLAEFLQEFLRRRQAFRPAAHRPPEPEAVAEAFGRPVAELKALNRRQLARLYRRRARELHPDRGGSHERFIRLAEAYQELLRGRR
ncbi:MAG: hypothetical protein WHT06_02860 [Desulfobacterales bacterium]